MFLLKKKYLTFRNVRYLELPGVGGEDMISTKLKFSWTKGKFDLVVKNAAGALG